MTTTPSFTVTTTLIPRGDNPRLLISYDFTALEGLTQAPARILQSLIDQAIAQWWSGLTRFQRSALAAQPVSSKTSEPLPSPISADEIPLLRPEDC
jgi:hypothetical protein